MGSVSLKTHATRAGACSAAQRSSTVASQKHLVSGSRRLFVCWCSQLVQLARPARLSLNLKSFRATLGTEGGASGTTSEGLVIFEAVGRIRVGLRPASWAPRDQKPWGGRCERANGRALCMRACERPPSLCVTAIRSRTGRAGGRGLSPGVRRGVGNQGGWCGSATQA